MLFSKDHRNLSDEGTDVDHQVEVHVDTRGRESGVDNDSLAILAGLDARVGALHLLGHKGRDVGLESSGSETHDDEGDAEQAQGTSWVFEHWRD